MKSKTDEKKKSLRLSLSCLVMAAEIVLCVEIMKLVCVRISLPLCVCVCVCRFTV